MYLKTKDYCIIMVAAVWLDIMEKIENKWYILISLEEKLSISQKKLHYLIKDLFSGWNNFWKTGNRPPLGSKFPELQIKTTTSKIINLLLQNRQTIYITRKQDNSLCN